VTRKMIFSSPNPTDTVPGRKHSPWTANRERKKNKPVLDSPEPPLYETEELLSFDDDCE
jgi:hypothetical protein